MRQKKKVEPIKQRHLGYWANRRHLQLRKALQRAQVDERKFVTLADLLELMEAKSKYTTMEGWHLPERIVFRRKVTMVRKMPMKGWRVSELAAWLARQEASQ